MNVGVKVLDTELLVGIFILFHEYTVFNLLVSACLLKVPGKRSAHKQHEVLESHEKEEKDDEGG